MTDKPHKRMGPAPLEGETLAEPRMIRFTPTLIRQIEKARGKGTFAAWVRAAARRALGLSGDATQDPSDAPDDH